ncbi:MAG: phosphotransferase family protein [Nocardioidaceae bacterium]
MNDANDARLIGTRVPYGRLPAEVRRWVTAQLGAPVVSAQQRVGGMSPAVAVSLRAANGATAFVKAVAPRINPDTPSMFRHEAAVLQRLPSVPYRARLIACYDDEQWVAIMLEDIAGRHPDWSSTSERDAVLAAVQAQTAELTPNPGLPSNLGTATDGLAKHAAILEDPSSTELAVLPGWTRAELPALTSLVLDTTEAMSTGTFCHWDIRHDNILVRDSDQQPVLLDWGMSRAGPAWGDTAVYALEWVEEPYFDDVVATLHLDRDEQTAVTGLIAGLGLYCLMMSTHPHPPSLPNLPAFRGELGRRCLIGVRRRLGIPAV